MAWKTVVVVVNGKKTTRKVWVPDPKPANNARAAAEKRARDAYAARLTRLAAAKRAAAAKAAAAQKALAAQRKAEIAERQQRAIRIAQRRAESYRLLAERRKDLLRRAQLVKDKAKDTTPRSDLTTALRPGMSARKPQIYEPGQVVGPRTIGRAKVAQARQRETAYWYRKAALRAATGPLDEKGAREAERILKLERDRAGQQKFDAETVSKLSERYNQYALDVGTRRNAVVDKIVALLDKAKKGNTAALKKARELYFSDEFKALDAEYERLFKEKGAFSIYWENYGAIEQSQLDYFKAQTQAALDADRSELNRRLKIARARGDVETVRQLTEMNRIYQGQTGTVRYRDRDGVWKERKRTVEEELDHREAQRRVEMEARRAEYMERLRGRRLTLRGKGLVELPTGEAVTPEAMRARREVDTWLSHGGQWKEMRRPEDIQQNAEAYLKDWERRNPRPAGNTAMWGQAGKSKAFQDWKDARDRAEREFYRHIAGLPGTPAWYERLMAAPGVSHGLAVLEGSVNVGITLGRVTIKWVARDLRGDKNATSQINLGVSLDDLPVGVRNAMKAAPSISPGTAGARTRERVLKEWLSTPEGKRWLVEQQAKQQAESQKQDSMLAAALYGTGTDPLTVAGRLSSAEGLDAINEFGRNPTTDPGANLLLQLALDPTNAIPLKFTTYFARAGYAAGRTGLRGNKLTKGYGAFRDFINADENLLKAQKRLKEIAPDLATAGVNPEKLADEIYAEVANLKKADVTRDGIRDLLIRAGVDRRLVNDTELLSLIENAITGRIRRAGLDYRDMSGEIRKQIAETQRVQRNIRVKRHEKAGRAERRIQKGLQYRAKAAEDAERKLVQMKRAEEARNRAKAAEARAQATAGATAHPQAGASEPLRPSHVGEKEALRSAGGVAPSRAPFPEPEIANKGLAVQTRATKEVPRTPGPVPGDLEPRPENVRPRRPGITEPPKDVRGHRGTMVMGPRGRAEMTLRYPNIAGRLMDAAAQRYVDETFRRVYTHTEVEDNINRAIRAVENEREPLSRHLPPTLRLQDPAAQPSKVPPALRADVASPVELQEIYYELRFGEWVPKGTFSEVNPLLPQKVVGQIKDLGFRAAAGDAEAAAKYQLVAQRLRAMFRTAREDGPVAPIRTSKDTRAYSGTFRPSQIDLMDRAGVTGDAAAEVSVREARGMLSYVRRVVAQQMAGRVPGGKFKPRTALRLDAEEIQQLVETDALIQKTILDAELRLPDGEMYNLAEDLLDAGSSARGVAETYEVFSGRSWADIDGYKVDLAAQIPWVKKVRSQEWRAKMTLTHFKSLLHSLDNSETFFRGATTGIERYRDGGLVLFELFHQLRLAGDVKRLKKYSAYVDKYLDELAGRDEADLSLFAWQWRVMETNAGLSWSRPFKEVHEGFRAAALTNGVHPDLALAMIPNGYMAAPSQWVFDLRGALAKLPETDGFEAYPPGWSDHEALGEISNIMHNYPFDDGRPRPASRVIAFLAARFGTFEKGKVMQLRLLDEMVNAAKADLGREALHKLLMRDYKDLIFRGELQNADLDASLQRMLWGEKLTRGAVKGVKTYKPLHDAIIQAWFDGALPLKNAEAHRLIWMAHLQDNPRATVNVTIAFLENMRSIGQLPEARKIVAQLFADDRANYIRRYADAIDDPAKEPGFTQTLEHQMWELAGQIPDAETMRRLADHYRSSVVRADAEDVFTGENTLLDARESAKLKELGSYYDEAEIEAWDAEAAAVGRKDPGASYAAADLSNLSIEMQEAISLAERVTAHSDRLIRREVIRLFGLNELVEIGRRTFGKDLSRKEAVTRAIDLGLNAGGKPGRGFLHDRILLARRVLQDVYFNPMTGELERGRNFSRAQEIANRRNGGAFIELPSLNRSAQIALRKVSGLEQVADQARRWTKLDGLIRAQARATALAVDKVDRLLLAIVENDIARMTGGAFDEVEEAVEVLLASPLGRELLEEVTAKVGETARWAKLESGRLDFYARRAHLRLLARVMPPKEFAQQYGKELAKLDEALSLSDEQWKARMAVADREIARRLATPNVSGGPLPNVPEIKMLDDPALPEMPKIEYPKYEPPVGDPTLLARAALADELAEKVAGMSLRQYYSYLALRADQVLRSKTASKAQKEVARRTLNEIKAVRYLDQLRSGAGPVPPAEVRAFGERVAKHFGEEAKSMLAPKYIAPFVQDLIGIFVEQGRTYYRRMMSSETAAGGVRRLGNAVDAPDHMPYELWVKVEREVQLAIRRVRDGYKANKLTKLRGLPAEGEPESRFLKRMIDKDPAILRAKKRVLQKYGISLAAYDEARTVLWTGHVQSISSARLLRKATERAARTGEALDEAYLAERLVEAEEEAVRRLEELARLRYGHKPEDIIEEFIARYSDDGTIRHPKTKLTGFQRRTLEAHLKAVSKEAGSEITDVTDGVQMQLFLTLRNAPPKNSREAAREFLVRIGAWSPRKADLINEGKASWSIDEEAEYWRNSWGTVPPWADRTLLSGKYSQMFHDPELYYERMREWGVLSRSAEIRLKLSGATADEVFESIMKGDPARGIRARRDLELQRRFVIERYGDLVYDEANGRLTAMPWLMTEAEKRVYFKTRTVRDFGASLIQGEGELNEVMRLVDETLDRFFDRYITAKSADGPILYEDVFRLASEVQARLLADPKWARRTRDIFGDALRAWAAFSRAMIFSQLSFVAVNIIDVPIKETWWRFTRRGFIREAARASAAARKRATELTLQRLGMDLETTLYRLNERSTLQRLRAPVRYGPVERQVERVMTLVQATYRVPPEIAGKVELAAKLRIARDIYPYFYDLAVKQGAKTDDLADAIALKMTKEQIGRMWPTAGDHPLARLWNEIVPFGIYTVKNKVLFLSEAAAHPWILNKIEFIGRYIEEHNLREWEKEHPGEEMPLRDRRRIELPWAPGYYMDLGQFSDATRGLAPLYGADLSKSIVDHASSWIRLINPGTLAAAGFVANTLELGGIRKWKPVLNADGEQTGWELVTSPWTEPWSDDAPGWGSFIWFIDAAEDADALGADGNWSLGDISVILGKLALFNAIQPGAQRGSALNEYYKALREKDRDKAALWLNGTPSGQYLQDWWRSLATTERDFVDFYSRTAKMAADKNLWLHRQTGAFQARVGQGYGAIKRIRDRYGAELLVLTKGTQEYRDKKAEMYLAISEVYRRFPELVDFEVYSKGPQEWAQQLAEWQQDKLLDDFFALDKKRPQRETYRTQAEYKQAYDAWLHTKQLFLKQYPQVEQALGQGRVEFERVRDQIEKEWDAVLDRIGTRGEAIEAAKRANDRELLDILYLQQELDFSRLDQERVALDWTSEDFAKLPGKLVGPPALRDKALKRAELFVDFETRRRRKAEREGRLAEYLDQKFYGDGMAEVIRKAKGGDPFGEFDPAVFVAEMKKRPRLLAMYEKENPGIRQRWARSDDYIRFISRWGKLAKAGRWDEAQRVWDSLPQWVKDRYYAKHPERRRRAQETAAYSGWMQRWVAHFERGDSKGGMEFFWKMPSWVRERYFAKNPEKRLKYEADLKYGKQLADYFAADKEMRARLLRDDPAFARWLAKNVTTKESRRIAILAAYRAIPADEQWLRRVFREKYPEIFSQEAKGEARLRKVYDKLAAHPEMLPEFEAWVKAIWDSYAQMLMKGQSRPLSSYYERDYGEVPARRRRRSLSAAEASA